MTMHWRKLGLVYSPNRMLAWSRTHAMVPTPLLLDDLGVLRVFHTCCDATGIGRPGYVDLDPQDPTRVIGSASAPLMDIGLPGTFDENGVLPTSVVEVGDGRIFMYYVGFELGTKIRYRLLTGLAISEDNGATFVRHSRAPILDRSDEELYFRGGPFVMRDRGLFRMWYVAGSRWIELAGKLMPEYRVRYLESANGMRWGDSGKLTLDITQPDEYGFGRPWVVRIQSGYALYYSVRRKSFGAYRMGYAESVDAGEWTRMDAHLGLDVGPGDFDDQAIMYAAPIVLPDGRTWCFYNGNDFGRDGIALALRED